MRADIKQKVKKRLNIVLGQIKGLSLMVEKEEYCIDIMAQSMAVKEALSGIEDLMLENHLTTHVKAQFKGGKSQKAVSEIIKIYKLAKRKK